MTETLTGKQVLALLSKDEVPEIEYLNHLDGKWREANLNDWRISEWRRTPLKYRIKPTPARRLSVTLANGEVVSWPEPVRGGLKERQKYWVVCSDGVSISLFWGESRTETNCLAFGNVHLTREAAQEHADALRKINTQGVTC